ncbi:hypothetical protein CgunFtcFv8_008227 [Champsocephalus gunnari]|uniref:Uncharacterized protein n=1 Tax=Champsocephalus gunnari TaxID=52237 RepID=A0AAN8D559_CHAGU|nr:hypothetical protein CgunFtcFv8_008227 [Champsocephalus gunnari]
MPGSDRHHGTKRKPESSSLSGVPQQTQASTRTSAGDKTSKEGKVLVKSSMSSSSTKRKRHKLTKHNRESSAPGAEYVTLGDAAAPPGVNTVKPLVEYDDISSDSDTFSDPPSSRPSERGGGDLLEPSPDYDRQVAGAETGGMENKGHKHSRKKPKDPNKVRDPGNGERGIKKKNSKDHEKGVAVKNKEKAASSGTTSKRHVQPEGDSKRAELMLTTQPAASVGSATSSTSSSRSKESSRSGKTRKEKQQRKEGRAAEGSQSSSQRNRTDKTHRKASKSLKSSPKGKSSNRGSPRRKGTNAAHSPSPRRAAGSESPQASGYGQQVDDTYSRRRVAQQSPNPYGDTSRRSRQRSDSPYGSRHRSSSYERDSSPYSRRRSISPYGTRRSSSNSPMSRRSGRSRSRSPMHYSTSRRSTSRSRSKRHTSSVAAGASSHSSRPTSRSPPLPPATQLQPGSRAKSQEEGTAGG